LGALGDAARLRILRLLSSEELTVGELAKALQLPQSTISRHLKVLHDGGWTVKRAEGPASLFRVVVESLDSGAASLWSAARDQMGDVASLGEDDARLREVLAERRADSRSFFGRVGGEWDHLREQLFGPDFTSAALLGLIPTEWTVADLGCGTGNAAELLAPLVKKVIVVDREPAMLAAARKRLAGQGNVEFRKGDLLDPPLRRNEVDAGLFFLVLHHLESPQEAIAATARGLRSRGAILIVDMMRHDRVAWRHTMGHRHLGFTENDVRRWADESKLTLERFARLRADTTARGPALFAAMLRRS